MKDLENIMNDYERYRQALSKLNEVNKGVVFDALAAATITAVNVDFDGVGDSGQINSVVAFSGTDQADVPTAIVTRQEIRWGSTETFTTQMAVEEAIENLCYSYLEETHGGWENNDGAYGEFHLDVVKRRIELEFNGRFTDTWTNNHSF